MDARRKKYEKNYPKMVAEVRKYDDVPFRASKRFTASQKRTISNRFKRLRPFLSKKAQKGDFRYQFLEGAHATTAEKAFKTKKGVFIQIPRRVKGKITKHVYKGGTIAKIDYTNGKSGRAKRRDYIVAVNAKQMVKDPERYLAKIRKELGLTKGEVLGVHLLFRGFQNRNRYSLGYFVRYLSEPTERFDKLKRRRKINEVITGIKLVTIRKTRTKTKKSKASGKN
jgi:hypothetical protein